MKSTRKKGIRNVKREGGGRIRRRGRTKIQKQKDGDEMTNQGNRNERGKWTQYKQTVTKTTI